MFTVTEASDFKVEAETLDLSNLVPDAPGFSQIEDSGAASSNGQNVGHFSRGYIEGYFVTETDLNLIIESIISNAEVGSTSKTRISSIQIDDTILEFDEVALGPDGDNLYYNYKTVTTESVAEQFLKVHIHLESLSKGVLMLIISILNSLHNKKIRKDIMQ